MKYYMPKSKVKKVLCFYLAEHSCFTFVSGVAAYLTYSWFCASGNRLGQVIGSKWVEK